MFLKNSFLQKYRFKLLLAFILIYLIFPAFITSGIDNLIIVITLSFILIQSIWVFTGKRRNAYIVTVAAMLVLGITWFSEIFDPSSPGVKIFQLGTYVLFFAFVMVALFRFLIKTKVVTVDSIIIAASIYCIFGIIGGSLSMLLNNIFPGLAYSLPESIKDPNLLDFTYYSFVTLTTLGYGDITPIRQESQTLGYLLAVVGQFYIAIIVAILVSKLVTKDTQANPESENQ